MKIHIKCSVLGCKARVKSEEKRAGVTLCKKHLMKQTQKEKTSKTTKGEERIKCNNCNLKTGFVASDFTKDKDLTEIYCSEECRYNFETGNSGEEY